MQLALGVLTNLVSDKIELPPPLNSSTNLFIGFGLFGVLSLVLLLLVRLADNGSSEAQPVYSGHYLIDKGNEARYSVWPMSEFTPDLATVHSAIGDKPLSTNANLPDSTPPHYVQRDYDQALASDIVAAAGGGLHSLIVLSGGSSTGKTRSLYEAVKAHCTDFQVIRPRTMGALVALREEPASEVLNQQSTVLWLNELQGFLGPNNTGLNRALLADLFSVAERPLVIVATLWPSKLRDATAAAEEENRDNRELLLERIPDVRWHQVGDRFSPAEIVRARTLASTDARIDQAILDRERFGFTQTLSGASELLTRYNSATHVTKLLLDSAADARRLGVQGGIPGELLRAMTYGLWREENGPVAPPKEWFEHSVSEACEPVIPDARVRPLLPLVDPEGYTLADFLEQHLGARRYGFTVRQEIWQALLAAAPDQDLLRVAQAARARARVHIEFDFLERAVASSSPRALRIFARWHEKRGFTDAAESLFREAGDRGDPEANLRVAKIRVQRGDTTGSERALEAAAEAGSLPAIYRLARSLELNGHADMAEQRLRLAADTGGGVALWYLGNFLARNGHTLESAHYLRSAACAGNNRALRACLKGLDVNKDASEIEELLARAASVKDRALRRYCAWLTKRGRSTDARELLYREVANGRRVRDALADILRREGQVNEAEEVLRDREIGDRRALIALAELLQSRQPTAVESLFEQAQRDGDSAVRLVAARWFERPSYRDLARAESLIRDSLVAGEPEAPGVLGAFLMRHDRAAESEALRAEGADEDGRTRMPM